MNLTQNSKTDVKWSIPIFPTVMEKCNVRISQKLY